MPSPQKKKTKSTAPNIPFIDSPSPSKPSPNESAIELSPSPKRKGKKTNANGKNANTNTIHIQPRTARIPSNTRDSRIVHGPAFKSTEEEKAASAAMAAESSAKKKKKKKKAPPSTRVSSTGDSNSGSTSTSDPSPLVHIQHSDDDEKIVPMYEIASSSSEDCSSDDDDESCIEPKKLPPLTEKQLRIERAVCTKVRKLLESRPSREGVAEDLNYLKEKILTPLMVHRNVLMYATQVVDNAMSKGGAMVKFLGGAIPTKINVRAGKSVVVNHCLAAWRVLDVVLFHSAERAQLSRQIQHDLNDYICMMERAFNYCKAIVEEEENSMNNLKSEKMPPDEEHRGYCMDGAKKPKQACHRICPKCNDPFMHEPPSNVEIRKRNEKLTAMWEAKNNEFEKYTESLPTRNPLPAPLDMKGNPMKKRLPPVVLEQELLVCKAYTRTQSYSKDGFQCPNCNNRTCLTCRNNCRFVVLKR